MHLELSLLDLARVGSLAGSLFFLSYSLAAAFTTTEPDISRSDLQYRAYQAVVIASMSLACACLFFGLSRASQ